MLDRFLSSLVLSLALVACGGDRRHGGGDGSVLDGAGDADAADANVPDPTRATLDEASEMILIANELTRATFATAGDPDFMEVVPCTGCLTDAQCETLETTTLGRCPSYALACNASNEIDAVTLKWGTSDCGSCERQGREMSGELRIAKQSAGVYVFTFTDFVWGALEIDGELTVTGSRNTTRDQFMLETGAAPLQVNYTGDTRTVGVDIVLDPLVFEAPKSGADRYVFTLAGTFTHVSSGRVFDLRTRNVAGTTDPLKFSGRSEECYGPTTGSIQSTITLDARSIQTTATFGSASGLAAVCSRPSVDVRTTPADATWTDYLTTVATALKTRLEAHAGNVSDASLVGRDGLVDAADRMKPLVALTKLATLGDLNAALEDGWTSLDCDAAATTVPCDSGTGTTDVTCSSGIGNPVNGVTATFADCVIDGVLYDGAFVMHRENPEDGDTTGVFEFTDFVAGSVLVDGEVMLIARSSDPLDVELRTTGEELAITVGAGGDACTTRIRFDVFRYTEATGDLEIEFNGHFETAQGEYGLTTIENAGRHATWDLPPGCTCPRDGTVVDILTPKLLGLVDQAVTMRVTYGPSTTGACSTVASVDFPDWPYSAAREAATAAAIEPLLEALCTGL